MKNLIGVACGLCAIAGTASISIAEDAPSVPAWTVTVADEARYFSWKSTRGYPVGVAAPGGGSEFYMPFAAQIVGHPNDDWKLELLGRGGWVWAHQSTSGLSGTEQTTTDTTASATLTYLQIAGIQPFGSLVFNLPTGQSALFGTAANARMDPDLVDISDFGEGFNIGETLGVNVPVGKQWMLTASVGYTSRGSYERESGLAVTVLTQPLTQTPTMVEPGDVVTYYAAAAYQSERLSGSLNGTVSSERPTSQNDTVLYQPGLRYLLNATVSYNWPDNSRTTLNFSGSHSNRNDVVFAGTAVLVREMMNTNSDLLRVNLEHLIPIGNFFAVGPTGSFLYRDHNGYDSSTLQFVPAKERWTVGALARYAATNNITINARVDFVWTHEDDRPAPNDLLFDVLQNAFIPASVIPPISSTGLQTALGANIKF